MLRKRGLGLVLLLCLLPLVSAGVLEDIFPFLSPGGKELKIIVRDSADESGIIGADVKIKFEDTGQLLYSTKTLDNGYTPSLTLQTGRRYKAEASKYGYNARTYSFDVNDNTFNQVMKLTRSTSTNTGVSATRQVKVTIKDSQSGSGISGATVDFYEGADLKIRTNTDSQGVAFANLEVGKTYSVAGERSDYSRASKGLGEIVSGAGTQDKGVLYLIKKETSVGTPSAPSQTNQNVMFIILGSANTRVPNARVEVYEGYSALGAKVAEVGSDANGNTGTIQLVSGRAYYVKVSPQQGYVVTDKQISVPSLSGGTHVETITLNVNPNPPTSQTGNTPTSGQPDSPITSSLGTNYKVKILAPSGSVLASNIANIPVEVYEGDVLRYSLLTDSQGYTNVFSLHQGLDYVVKARYGESEMSKTITNVPQSVYPIVVELSISGSVVENGQVICEDNDANENVDTFGVCIPSNGERKEDRCENGNLIQYSCLPSGACSRQQPVECPEGKMCLNGACVETDEDSEGTPLVSGNKCSREKFKRGYFDDAVTPNQLCKIRFGEEYSCDSSNEPLCLPGWWKLFKIGCLNAQCDKPIKGSVNIYVTCCN